MKTRSKTASTFATRCCCGTILALLAVTSGCSGSPNASDLADASADAINATDASSSDAANLPDAHDRGDTDAASDAGTNPTADTGSTGDADAGGDSGHMGHSDASNDAGTGGDADGAGDTGQADDGGSPNDAGDAGTATDSDGSSDSGDGEVGAPLLEIGQDCLDNRECASDSCLILGMDIGVCTAPCEDTCVGEDLVCLGGACLPIDYCEPTTNIGPGCVYVPCAGGCATNAECVVISDTEDRCLCSDYFQGNGYVACEDIPECDTDNGNCGDQAFVRCLENFGAPPTCQDIPECDTGNGDCGDPAFVACLENFGAPPTCQDIPECDTDNGECGDPAFVTCLENFGAPPTCQDVPECDTDNGNCGNPELYECREQFGAPPDCVAIYPPGLLDVTFGSDGRVDLGTGASSMRAYGVTVGDTGIVVVGDIRPDPLSEPSCMLQHLGASGESLPGGSFYAIPSDGNDACSLRAVTALPSGIQGFAGLAALGTQQNLVTGRFDSSLPSVLFHARSGATVLSPGAVLAANDGGLHVTGRSAGMRGAYFSAHLWDLSLAPGFGDGGYTDLARSQLGDQFIPRAMAQVDAWTNVVVGTWESDASGVKAAMVFVRSVDGLLDDRFGSEGVVAFDRPDQPERFFDVQVSGNRILAIGSTGFGSDEDAMAVAFTLQGQLDLTYGVDGVFASGLPGRDRPYGTALDAAGRLIVAGEHERLGVAQASILRVLADGQLDATFQAPPNGGLGFGANETEARDVVIDGQGRILVVGHTRDATTRLESGFLVRLLP